MKQQKISIIIPYYNGGEFYVDLLKSIKSAISEAKAVFEIVVIIDSMDTDQNSLDQLTRKTLESCPAVVILFKNKMNIGVAGSRNAALKLVTGNYFHLIDQDDRIDKTFYSTVESFLGRANFILINGISFYTDHRFNAHKLFYIKPKLSLKQLLKDDFIRSPGQVVFSKDLIKNFGFPEPKHYKGADDRFFWIKMFLTNSLLIKPHYIVNPLYFAYIHNNNYSSDSLNLRKSTLENWEMLMSEINTSSHTNLIRKDILSLKFAAGEKMRFSEKLTGACARFFYFFNLNKMIRFYYKRLHPKIRNA